VAKTIQLDKYLGEVLEERYNPLIKRLELVIRLGHPGEGTPSRGLLRIALSKHYGKPVEQVIIRSLETEYGVQVSRVEAHVYDDASSVKLFEPEYIIKRNDESLQKVQQQR
jgi:small subunit ribosomal protein S24e